MCVYTDACVDCVCEDIRHKIVLKKKRRRTDEDEETRQASRHESLYRERNILMKELASQVTS